MGRGARGDRRTGPAAADPLRRAYSTSSRATRATNAGPCSSSTIDSIRSMPAVTPALVRILPSRTNKTESSTAPTGSAPASARSPTSDSCSAARRAVPPRRAPGHRRDRDQFGTSGVRAANPVERDLVDVGERYGPLGPGITIRSPRTYHRKRLEPCKGQALRRHPVLVGGDEAHLVLGSEIVRRGEHLHRTGQIEQASRSGSTRM